MKKVFLIPGLLLLALVSSYGDIGPLAVPEYEYTPVMMKRADLERSVNYQPGERALSNPGKIYAKPPYIFVSERYKGVHVINNTDPAHPVKEAFITAPGCLDMAVKGDIIYLDNAVDLVAFDFAARRVTQRLRNVLPEPLAPDKSGYYSQREEGMIVVEWKKNPGFNKLKK
jgi:hypothetical protein